MSRPRRRKIFALLAVVPMLAGSASAQNAGLALGGESGKEPVNITADNGIEWRQSERVYIARGNVQMVRGKVTVYADEMRAYYRPTKGATTKADAAPPAAAAPPGGAKPRKTGPDLDEGSTEVYRLEASGKVRFVTETQTAYGERAVYDIDQTLLVMTGKNLKVVTPHDTLTARDSLEWYDGKQIGVARGDAVDDHDGKKIAADVLVAVIVRGAPGQESHVDRVDAQGHVFVSSQDQIGRGDQGVYNAGTGIVTLAGNVRLTRNENELRGEYGVVDLNRNVGYLLPSPPGTTAASGPRQRVQGLIVPPKKPTSPAAAKPAVTVPPKKPGT